MGQMNLRIDDETKKQADNLFNELGMSTQTAINVFVREAIRMRGFPFEVRLDPFYSAKNQEELKASIADMAAGRGLVMKTMDELKAMEDE